MMKRVLFSLALFACGLAPAIAGPYQDGRGERGGPARGREAGEPFEGRPYAGRPYAGRPFGARPFEARAYEGRPYGGRPFEGRPDLGEGREMPPPMPGPMRRHADQDRARAQMRAGEIRPLRDIQQQWRQDMPGYDFLGSDYDPGAGSYRLKFLRDGSVIWIDVDGRTGREIGRRGR